MWGQAQFKQVPRNSLFKSNKFELIRLIAGTRTHDKIFSRNWVVYMKGLSPFMCADLNKFENMHIVL